MPRLSPQIAIALACAAVAIHSTAAAAAPGIWRCGNSYSDAPCEGGQQIESQAPPSAEARRHRDEATRRDQAVAERLQRERLELDAQPRRAVVIGEPPRKAPAATGKGSGKTPARPKKPDGFTATYSDPAAKPPGKKKKSGK